MLDFTSLSDTVGLIIRDMSNSEYFNLDIEDYEVRHYTSEEAIHKSKLMMGSESNNYLFLPYCSFELTDDLSLLLSPCLNENKTTIMLTTNKKDKNISMFEFQTQSKYFWATTIKNKEHLELCLTFLNKDVSSILSEYVDSFDEESSTIAI